MGFKSSDLGPLIMDSRVHAATDHCASTDMEKF